jgi:hypothetical protein
MKKPKTLQELKKELNWLETNPFYIGRDGMPDLKILLFIILTGIIWGFLIVLIYKKIKKRNLKKKIKNYSEVNKNGK